MRASSSVLLLFFITAALHASDAPDTAPNDSLVIQAASMQLMDYSKSLMQALDGATVPAGGGTITITYQGESVPVVATVVLVEKGESIHVTPAPYAAAPYDDLHLMLTGGAGKPLTIAAVTATTSDGIHIAGYASGQGDLTISYHSTVTQGSVVIAAADLPTLVHVATITAAPPATASAAPATPFEPQTITTLTFDKPYVPADTAPNQITISPETP